MSGVSLPANGQARMLLTTLSRLLPLAAFQQWQSLNDPNHVYVKCWECGYRID
jgi:hypothetical protein